MKCQKCGKDFPSDYYFETNMICKQCFAKMNEDEKQKAYKQNYTKSAKKDATQQIINGIPLQCPVCKHDKFWSRKTLMNTPGATFFGVEWANKEAQNYICNKCGYIYWFFND
jgi:uncharacterized OB-fold protein